MTSQQVPTLAGQIVKHQEGFVALSTEEAQVAILDTEAFIACACEAWKTRCISPKSNDGVFLHLLSGAEKLTLDATTGTEVIAEAGDVFTGGIDANFRNWKLDGPQKTAPKVKVRVHEMIENGKFAEIFNGLSGNLDAMCLSQGQIIQFCATYRHLLRTEGYGTFFLFKVNDECFVAAVDVRGGGRLSVGVYLFSDDDVWSAVPRHRFVVPQLPLVS